MPKRSPIIFLTIFLLNIFITPSARGFDDDTISTLQRECVDLGFKPNTSENGKCVLKLLNTNSAGSGSSSAEARIKARQKEYARDAEIAAKERELEVLRIKQAEQLELQRRSVAAQEQAAQAQSNAASAYMLNNTMQMMMGTGAYYKPPTNRNPIICNTFGNITTCDR